MILRGERGASRSRALVESFRPLPRANGPSLVITGFGVFPNAPRNVTSEIIAAIAKDAGIAMRRPSLRAPDFLAGRGVIDGVGVSLMVLPVLWDAAAALVAKEARATRAGVVVMCGVASKLAGITIEGFSTTARRTMKDRFGVKPAFQRAASSSRKTTFDTERARASAEAAIAREDLSMAVVCRGLDGTNDYVCNGTAHVTARLATRSARVLRSGAVPEGVAAPRMNASHGFVHWPSDIPPERVGACARVLVAMSTSLVDALNAKRAA